MLRLLYEVFGFPFTKIARVVAVNFLKKSIGEFVLMRRYANLEKMIAAQYFIFFNFFLCGNEFFFLRFLFVTSVSRRFPGTLRQLLRQ
jgi:hypothetical protein